MAYQSLMRAEDDDDDGLLEQQVLQLSERVSQEPCLYRHGLHLFTYLKRLLHKETIIIIILSPHQALVSHSYPLFHDLCITMLSTHVREQQETCFFIFFNLNHVFLVNSLRILIQIRELSELNIPNLAIFSLIKSLITV